MFVVFFFSFHFEFVFCKILQLLDGPFLADTGRLHTVVMHRLCLRPLLLTLPPKAEGARAAVADVLAEADAVMELTVEVLALLPKN